MLKRYQNIVGGIFRGVDAAIIGVAWVASYWLRFYLPLIEVTKGLPEFSRYAALTPLVVILWMMVFSALRVYRSRRMLRRTDEAHLLLKAHGIALLFFIALTYLVSEYKYSRGVMIYFGVLGGLGLVCTRLALRNSLRTLRRKGYNLRYVLGVGEGRALETLFARMDKFPEMGLRVIGVITQEGSPLKTVGEKPVLGHFGQLHSLLHEKDVDQILISLPHNQQQALDRILKSLHDETVDIQLVPDVHEYVTLGCAIEEFEGLPIVNLNDSPLEGWGGVAKRATDLVLSLALLLVLAPVFFLLALCVKLSSPGPILYRQERMGLDGEPFEMLKFRTMRQNAEQTSGAVWAKAGDERRTKIGSFLRATSLDELPQLWNVLKGEMSLVGPRPERPVFVEQFRGEIPNYMLRHKVKSGMTGWAQVNGWRGDTSLSRRIECDLYYIRNWSYGLDFKILAMTLWKGFIHKNAY